MMEANAGLDFRGCFTPSTNYSPQTQQTHHSITVLQNALLKLTITCEVKIAIRFRNDLLISYTILTEILGRSVLCCTPGCKSHSSVVNNCIKQFCTLQQIKLFVPLMETNFPSQQERRKNKVKRKEVVLFKKVPTAC